MNNWSIIMAAAIIGFAICAAGWKIADRPEYVSYDAFILRFQSYDPEPCVAAISGVWKRDVALAGDVIDDMLNELGLKFCSETALKGE